MEIACGASILLVLAVVIIILAVWLSPRNLREIEDYCHARAEALDAYDEVFKSARMERAAARLKATDTFGGGN